MSKFPILPFPSVWIESAAGESPGPLCRRKPPCHRRPRPLILHRPVPYLGCGKGVIILLMAEILHQLISSLSYYL